MKGFVLIITLLFMTILTTLILSLMKLGVLETKISNYYIAKNISQINAENKLTLLERDLKNGKPAKNAEVISKQICGVTFYKITVTEKNANANTTIQSTFAKIGDQSTCQDKQNIKEGRQSWHEE